MWGTHKIQRPKKRVSDAPEAWGMGDSQTVHSRRAAGAGWIIPDQGAGGPMKATIYGPVNYGAWRMICET